MLARVSKCGEIVGRERSCFFFFCVVCRRATFSLCIVPQVPVRGLVMCDGWSVLRIIFSSIFCTKLTRIYTIANFNYWLCCKMLLFFFFAAFITNRTTEPKLFFYLINTI